MPVRRHIQGIGLSHVQTEDGAYHAYHRDEQGSTVFITGRDGLAENCYVYDAFGNVPEKKEDIRNRILYTGQQYDRETGQYYLRARYYNPIIGRFTQEDTYRGDGLNLYAYCGNNPVVYYDPNGQDGIGICPPPNQAEHDKQEKGGESGTTSAINDDTSGIDLYRGMMEDGGKHKVGDSVRTLGVRPDVDIPVDANGMVYPKTGGMSVSPSPDDLPTHRKPPEFGGTGKDPVWGINTDDLGPDLIYVPDNPGHGTIQPAKPMSLKAYQNALANTNINWEKV